MTRDEALEIAFSDNHATVTFDLAARVIHDTGTGRDNAVYAQLAELKAAIQRRGGDWQGLLEAD
jgi:hypothetical protein